MKKNVARYLATVGVGTGLLAYLLSTSVGGRAGGSLTPAWGQTGEESDSGWTAKDVLGLWPDTARKVAGVMIEEYGQPTRVTISSLVWTGRGAWKRTTVYRDGWVDQASVVHPELLEQVVSYRVPRDRVYDVEHFDPRIKVDSVKHELLMRSDSEKMNFLAINLADEIVARWKTVEEARAYSAKVAQLSEAGKKSEYTEGFMFQVYNDFRPVQD
jgi:hypothetical protein